MPFNRSLTIRLSVWCLCLSWLPATGTAQSTNADSVAEAQSGSVAAGEASVVPSEPTDPVLSQPLDSSDQPLSLMDDRPLVNGDLESMQATGWGFDPYADYYLAPFVPWIHVTGRLMWLHRTEAARGQALVSATTPIASGPVLTTDHLNFPTEAGVRGAILFGLNQGQFIELNYLGVFDQQAQASVDLDPVTTGVTDMTQFFFGSATTSITTFDATAVYESSLHTTELNWWLRDNDWRLRPMVGIRWFQQAENFDLFETSAPGNGGSAEMKNNLLGAQVGFQTVLWQRAEWFRVQAIGKAGACRNQIDLDATARAGGVPVAAISRSFNATSFTGEVVVSAIWQLTPHLSFHVGYTGLWLTETGLVANQSDNFDVFAGTGAVELGTISYQGGHLGCTITW